MCILIFYTGWNRGWYPSVKALCGKFLFPAKLTEVVKLHRETREPMSLYTEMWRPYALNEKVCSGHSADSRHPHFIVIQYKNKHDQELWERTQLPCPPIKLKLSTGKPGFNSCQIVQMERKTKADRDNTWTGFWIFREPD